MVCYRIFSWDYFGLLLLVEVVFGLFTSGITVITCSSQALPRCQRRQTADGVRIVALRGPGGYEEEARSADNGTP